MSNQINGNMENPEKISINPSLSPPSPSQPAEILPNDFLNENNSNSSPNSSKLKYKVEERTILWKEKIDERLKNIRETKKSHELDGCTFEPIMVTKKSPETIKGGISHESKKSYEKYLKRMQNVRTQKETFNKKSELKPGAGNIWKNKVTIPQPPKFLNPDSAPILEEVKSLSKVFLIFYQ